MRLVSYLSPGFPETLFEFLAARIGAEVHFETATSGPPAGEDPFRDGTFDLGWICSTSFVDLALRAAPPSIRLVGIAWVPDDPDALGRPVYFGDIVVRADSPASSLSDLAGGRIACNDVVSLSGHHRSLDALIAGSVDACVVDSVVRIGRARGDEAVAGLRVIQRLGPWPVQPLAARHDLDPTAVVRVGQALLEANEPPAVRDALAAAALTRFVTVADDHYAPVRDALDRCGPSGSRPAAGRRPRAPRRGQGTGV